MKFNFQLLVLSVAALIFVSVGAARFVQASNDFVPVYTGARCLLHGCNPYDTGQLEKQFFQGGGRREELPSWDIDVPVYPPSTLLVLSPLALLRFPAARLLWFLLNSCLFVSATALIVSSSPLTHRWVATILAAVFLLSSSILLVLGQPAIFAISLAVIGSCLLLRGRDRGWATAAFMLSLAVKPQIGAFLVLYFLSRRIQWRSAAIASAGALALLISSGLLLTLHPQSASWTTTLRSNLTTTLGPDGSADPRPGNPQAIGDTNLQALTSVFFADARKFNLTAYAIFGLLFVLWATAALPTAQSQWLAIGALSVLSLTPIYHRFYDTRLLLLSIPAVVVIWQKRRILGIAMFLLTLCAVVSLQYRMQNYLMQHAKWQNVLQNKLLFVLLLRQQNLELLLLFSLYLFALFSFRLAAPTAANPRAAYQPAITLSR